MVLNDMVRWWQSETYNNLSLLPSNESLIALMRYVMLYYADEVWCLGCSDVDYFYVTEVKQNLVWLVIVSQLNYWML